MVVRTQAAGHEAGTSNAEQVGQSREKYKHGHTQGNSRHLIWITDLPDEKGVRHVVNHGDQLADDRWNH